MHKNQMKRVARYACFWGGIVGGIVGGTLGVSHSSYAQTRPTTNDCEIGSTITAVTSSAGVARMGSVFSTTLYDPTNETNNTTHNPKKLQVRVTKNGVAKANCSVVWQPANGANSTNNGWVFADNPVTDANGYVSAWWVAGSVQNQTLNVSIQQTDGVIKSVPITGTAYPHNTRANSIHVAWNTPAWEQFKVDVTPQTWEPTTYYMAIGFDGGYSGIQSSQTLFSLWDVNGVSPIVVDKGISTCSNFGGEGTGIKCEAPIVPKVGVAYRFELQTAVVVAGKQDYTMYFTDLSTNVKKKLGTLRIPVVKQQSGAYGFVEDWYTEGTSCLSNPVRAARYSNVSYLDTITKTWVAVNSATGDAVYTPNHNEVCSNYKFDFANGVFNLSTGGTSVGYPLNLPGSAKTYPNAWTDVPPAPAAIALTSGVPVNGIALNADISRLYSITVPAGKTKLTITSSGGSGDADLYVKLGVAPTLSSYLQASEGATTVENITVNAPAAGIYYILMNASAGPISGVSLKASLQ